MRRGATSFSFGVFADLFDTFKPTISTMSAMFATLVVIMSLTRFANDSSCGINTRFASIHRVLSVVPTASGVPPKRGPPCKQGATDVCIRHCGSAPRITMWLTMSFSLGPKQHENDNGPLQRRPGDFTKSQPTLLWKPLLRLASVSFSFCFRGRASADPSPRSHGSLTIHRVVLIHGSHRFIVY